MTHQARVCLVRPLLSRYEQSGHPVELTVLAAALQREGFEVVIKDYEFLKDVSEEWRESTEFSLKAAKDIISTDCDFAGITAYCSNYVLAIDIAKQLKKLKPEIHITIGGPHATICGKETMDIYPYIDSIAAGEGEVTYPELINAVMSNLPLGGVQGIIYRDASGHIVQNQKRPLLQNLDDSPFPAYHLLDFDAYISLKKTVSIYVGSGCPFNCNFCTTALVWERKYRTKSVERIIEEIAALYRDYGVNSFDFIHDNLTSNKKLMKELLDGIKRLPFKIDFEFSSRTDTIDVETIEEAGQVGCQSIFFGIESASEKTQNEIGKRLKLDKISDILNACIRNRIAPVTAFIIGFPHEKRDELEKTIRMAFQSKIFSGEVVVFNVLKALTGSRLFYESLDKLILDIANLPPEQTYFLSHDHLKEVAKHPFIYSNYYYFDYNNSFLTHVDYLRLHDFVTIMIVNYIYTMHVFINELEVSPIMLFNYFRPKIESLSREDLDTLNFIISEHEINNLLTSLHLTEDPRKAVLQAYQYDRIVFELSRSLPNKVNKKSSYYFNNKNWLLYQSKLSLIQNEPSYGNSIFGGVEHFYIVSTDKKETMTCEISELQYRLLDEIRSTDNLNAEEVGTYFSTAQLQNFFKECCDIGMFELVA